MKPLTPREKQILALIAQGNTRKEAAYKLSLSPKTVGIHLTNITNKLNIRGIANLTRYAVANSIIN